MIMKLTTESAKANGDVSIASERMGYVGQGYATGFLQQEDSLTFPITMDEEGQYQITVMAAVTIFGEGPKWNAFFVNGDKLGDIMTPDTPDFVPCMYPKAYLRNGINEITIMKNWGGIDIDSILIEKAPSTDRSRFHVTPLLVDSNAAPYTRRLMNYLCDSYGHRILSGQETGGSNPPELEVIKRETGKLPAIRGLDFIDYSPSRLPFGSTSQETEEAIAWWRDGGIVTFCWHWNAPTDLINQPNKMWYSGFYTYATEFDLAKALENQESEAYRLILRDIDAIALQLQILQEHEVPVLWRPLHEAAGGWFWWGAKGAEACIQLWRLMYKRLTVHHQLHNLIWVWNGQGKDWYPGDDVVDIIGEDIYGGPRFYSSQYGRFHDALSYTTANKIIALTENGTIPDPDLLEQDEAAWAWFCTWAGEFVWKETSGERTYSDKHTEVNMLRKVYSHSKVVTKDHLPNLQTYRL
ncbi:glycosyl hydrolase [Paenibacillus solisilvae]|uniref:Glycosyl hydrolase n=1 Tax=Paenibacillus solisilvae TaxID=2486751 RepID=A0ABW0W376_9BACL